MKNVAQCRDEMLPRARIFEKISGESLCEIKKGRREALEKAWRERERQAKLFGEQK